VVSLFGVQLNPLAMVMEYAPKGDLHRLLNSRQKGTVRCSHTTHNIPLALRKRTPCEGVSVVVVSALKLTTAGLQVVSCLDLVARTRRTSACCRWSQATVWS
jgi:hypothetical protein